MARRKPAKGRCTPVHSCGASQTRFTTPSVFASIGCRLRPAACGQHSERQGAERCFLSHGSSFTRRSPSKKPPRLLHSLGPDTHVIAGGTDLLPNMKHGLVSPRHVLLRFSRSRRCARIEVDGDRFRIGAMTTLAEIARDRRVAEVASALCEAAQSVGGPHHRRMGNDRRQPVSRQFAVATSNQTHFPGAKHSAIVFKKDGSVCHVVAGGRHCVAAASNDTAGHGAHCTRWVRRVDGECSGRPCGLSEDFSIPRMAFATPYASTTRSSWRRSFPLLLDGAVRTQKSFVDATRSTFLLLSVAARADIDDGRIQAVDVVVSALAARPRRLNGGQRRCPWHCAGCQRRGGAIRSRVARKWQAFLDNVEGEVEWRHDMGAGSGQARPRTRRGGRLTRRIARAQVSQPRSFYRSEGRQTKSVPARGRAQS